MPDTEDHGVMNCRDARDLADSFFRGEMLTETNHEIVQHLAVCPSCRAENVSRRQRRDSLRATFDRAPDLEPGPDFVGRLRRQMRVAAATGRPQVPVAHRWVVVAASALLAAGLSFAIFMTEPRTSVDALARDAIGDHWNCALKNRRVRMPVPPEEAARRFDRAYR